MSRPWKSYKQKSTTKVERNIISHKKRSQTAVLNPGLSSVSISKKQNQNYNIYIQKTPSYYKGVIFSPNRLNYFLEDGMYVPICFLI